MGHSFFLTWCLRLQLAFVVGSGLELVALPDSVWGLRLQGLGVDGIGGISIKIT